MTETDEQVSDAAQKPPKTAAPVRKQHTLDQVVDAIVQNPDRKGVSVAAIKSHLAKQDSSLTAKVLKNRLRKALDKGFALNIIVRPKGSEHTGISLSGRFLVNKDKLKVIRKNNIGEGKPIKQASTDDNMPPKKVAKTAKKTTTNKENVAKTANKVVKAKPKVVKKTTTKTKEVVKANKTTTKTATANVAKAKVSKPKSTTTTKTVTAKKTVKVLKAKKTPGTPKITQPKKPRNM
jgi:hypothetical protein